MWALSMINELSIRSYLHLSDGYRLRMSIGVGRKHTHEPFMCKVGKCWKMDDCIWRQQDCICSGVCCLQNLRPEVRSQLCVGGTRWRCVLRRRVQHCYTTPARLRPLLALQHTTSGQGRSQCSGNPANIFNRLEGQICDKHVQIVL